MSDGPQAVITSPGGQEFIFNPETGWSGDDAETVAWLNKLWPAGSLSMAAELLGTYDPDPLFAPAYEASAYLGWEIVPPDPPEIVEGVVP